MAQIINNDKGFKVIKMRLVELQQATNEMTLGICDNCNNASLEGYYVAVLNRYLCKGCYEDWYKRAKYYPEDARIEEKNFNFYSEKLKSAGFLK